MVSVMFEVFRYLSDGEEQLLGCYWTEEEAEAAFDYYSEVRYPASYVDMRGPED